MNFLTSCFFLFGVLAGVLGTSGLSLADEAADGTPAQVRERTPEPDAAYATYGSFQAQKGEQLKDLAARSGGKMEVEPANAPGVPAPMLSALLPGQIVYARLGSFGSAADWASFAARLDRWIGQGASGIVLDVRSNGDANDFDGAGRVAGYLTPVGTPLFTVNEGRPNAHAYAGTNAAGHALPPVVVLTDGGTTGAAEILAACLQAHGALVIGGATAGRDAVFADKTLPSGETLHYVTGDVSMPGMASWWNHPVAPDIAVTVDATREKADLALIAQDQVAAVIREAAERHRLSEAALVRGDDPEIDALVAETDKKTPVAAVAQDAVLIDALDSLKAIRISRAGALGSPEAGAVSDGGAAPQ